MFRTHTFCGVSGEPAKLYIVNMGSGAGRLTVRLDLLGDQERFARELDSVKGPEAVTAEY